MKKYKILGIDPALRNLGLVNAELDLDTMTFEITNMNLVKSEGLEKGKAKQVRKNSDDLMRARTLYGGLLLALHGVDFVFVEVPVGSKSARAMASYGVCIGLVATISKPVFEVTPKEVKMAAHGRSTATKEEMIEAATKKYPDAPWLRVKRAGKMELVNDNEHLADACFAIEAGLRSAQFKEAVSLMRVISQQ